ncbi:MAG TPA: glycosyltransferase family 2 protein [Vicinamibacterales bacterium]|nr:glycosyltransferase family 2 protein [Vicinamibacterales bacterium]
MAVPVTATLITFNEAANIQAALESLSWADELIVVDSQSTDDTVAIARRFTDKVIVRPWPGYIAQKNFAAEQASHDWIFSLDADERVTPELAAEIKTLLASGPKAAGYRVPRVTFHLGRWMRSTDWYPDYQLRFYDRRRARWAGKRVHESVKADGPVEDLRGELQHYAYRDLAHHFQTMDRYTTLAARQMFEEGRRAGFFDLMVHPPAAFLRNYVLRGGFRDGVPGLIVSAMNARYVGLKFAKLWELCSPSTSTPRARGAGDSNKSS